MSVTCSESRYPKQNFVGFIDDGEESREITGRYKLSCYFIANITINLLPIQTRYYDAIDYIKKTLGYERTSDV